MDLEATQALKEFIGAVIIALLGIIVFIAWMYFPIYWMLNQFEKHGIIQDRILSAMASCMIWIMINLIAVYLIL